MQLGTYIIIIALALQYKPTLTYV